MAGHLQHDSCHHQWHHSSEANVLPSECSGKCRFVDAELVCYRIFGECGAYGKLQTLRVSKTDLRTFQMSFLRILANVYNLYQDTGYLGSTSCRSYLECKILSSIPVRSSSLNHQSFQTVPQIRPISIHSFESRSVALRCTICTIRWLWYALSNGLVSRPNAHRLYPAREVQISGVKNANVKCGVLINSEISSTKSTVERLHEFG